MSDLLYVFGEEILEEGKKIHRDVSHCYYRINKAFNKDVLKARQLGQFFLYPYFFKDDFRSIRTEDINIISKAGAMYFDLIVLNDSLVDKQLDMDADIILLKDYISCEYIRLFSRLFHDNELFWDYYYKYNSEFLGAVYLENERHYGKLCSYTYEEFKRIAHGKSALAKTTVAALGCLSGEYENIQTLEEPQDLFAEAAQLFDDLIDWKEDLKSGQYSWLLTKLMLKEGFSVDVDEKSVSDVIFGCGYDELILEKVNSLCQQAAGCSVITEAWTNRVRLMQQRINKLQGDLKATKIRNRGS